MMKKYEMIPEEKMFRIKALRDFGDVNAGDLGGLIERKSNLSHDDNCWVYGNARVSGYALVSGNARVFGNALISGYARVSGKARVYGDARVYGVAKVYGNARVFGKSEIFDNALISGYARVFGNALISGYARVYDNVLVSGDAKVSGYAKVSGSAQVYGNALILGNTQVSKTPPRASRSDGYDFIYVPDKDGIMRVIAGCRYFTMEEARKHWEKTRGGTPLGDETMDILDFLEKRVKS
jgi:carbonic anhydrase/acetyltransferase-like protein (isoleucine patch superfamily)